MLGFVSCCKGLSGILCEESTLDNKVPELFFSKLLLFGARVSAKSDTGKPVLWSIISSNSALELREVLKALLENEPGDRGRESRELDLGNVEESVILLDE